jgi:hypothetical protein
MMPRREMGSACEEILRLGDEVLPRLRQRLARDLR